MAGWEFEHSISTKAKRKDAWGFWTNMDNIAEMESGVERIEPDGPFATGTTGCTIASGSSTEWKLSEVIEGRRCVLTGITPERDGSLSFCWDFKSEPNGCRLTQRIIATGPLVNTHREVLEAMEINVPKAMLRLKKKLDLLGQQGD